MHPKIKELAEQAGLSHMPSNYPDMADLYKGADFELEKFAELIARECISECWTDATPKLIADNICKKFGIEE